MANEIKTAKEGLETLLEAGNSGLRVYDFWPDAINEYPAAVIVFESRSIDGADGVSLGDNSFEGTLRVTVAVAKGNDNEGSDEIIKFCEVSGTESIQAAIDSDNTWGGSVDTGRLLRIENVGPGTILQKQVMRADFVVGFLKTVA